MIETIQFIMALTLSGFLGYLVYKNIRRSEFLSAANLISVFAVIDFFVPAMIGAVTGKYLRYFYFEDIDGTTYFLATLLFSVSLGLFVLGWNYRKIFKIKGAIKKDESDYFVSESALFILFFAAICVTVLNYVHEFIACGSWENFYSFKIEREYLTTIEYNSLPAKVISFLSEFNMPILLIVTSVGIVNSRSLKHKIFWSKILPVISLCISALSLYRGSILSWFVMVIVSLQFINAKKTEKEKKKFNRIILLLGATAVFAFIAYGAARVILTSAHYGSAASVMNSLVATFTGTIGSMLTGFSRCLKYVGDGRPLFYGRSIFEMFYFFIPRFIWPGKPTHYGIVSLTMAMGSPDTTMDAVSIPGELVMNFWYSGLLLIPIVGFIFRLYEDLKKSPRFKYMYAATLSAFITTVMWMSFTGFFSRAKFFPIYALALLFIIRKKKAGTVPAGGQTSGVDDRSADADGQTFDTDGQSLAVGERNSDIGAQTSGGQPSDGKIPLSVVMSTYNENETELRAAVNSILGQSYKDFEFIIVLDNPENGMIASVISEYERADHRIRVVKNEKNLGLVRSLNKAIALAKGEYIARMDADDISVCTRFERELDFLKENALDMVCALKKDMNEAGEVYAEHGLPRMLPDDFSALLPFSTFVVHSSVIFKKELWERVGGYRSVKAVEDYDLWLRFLSAGAKMGLLNEFLLLYRVRGNSITANNRYRQACSTIFLQKSYKNGTLGSPDFLTRLEIRNEREKVNDASRAEAFSARFDYMKKTKAEPNKAKKVIMCGKVFSHLLIDPIYRGYMSSALRHKKEIKRLSSRSGG